MASDQTDVLGIASMLAVDDSWNSYMGDGIKCPQCGFEYVHFHAPTLIDGKDNYAAWSGRGDLIVVPFWGECGHAWELCFGFHKGNTNGFVRLCPEEAEEEEEFDYDTYLQSPEWHDKAEVAKRDARQRCQVCNAYNRQLHTHHRTYRNIGKELPGDLIVLCDDCHTIFHRNGKLAKWGE